jgi:hypothetical protein
MLSANDSLYRYPDVDDEVFATYAAFKDFFYASQARLQKTIQETEGTVIV